MTGPRNGRRGSATRSTMIATWAAILISAAMMFQSFRAVLQDRVWMFVLVLLAVAVLWQAPNFAFFAALLALPAAYLSVTALYAGFTGKKESHADATAFWRLRPW